MSIKPLPPADFVPSIRGYSRQGAFRFWCQTVLPLVYDDSLSYYELLNKVVVYLNNLIKDTSTLEDNYQLLYEAFVLLQKYVNSYFDSLDVQEEINHKLDAMVCDGTLSRLVFQYIGYVTPEQYGAKGDGTTDDTQAIVDALNNEYGFPVRFSKTYFISDPINLNNNSVLYGNGTILCDSGKNVIVGENINCCLIDGLKFKGDAKVGDTFTDNTGVINFINCKNVSVKNCCISNIKHEYCIVFFNCENVDASNNTIDTYVYIGIGALDGVDGFTVNNNKISNCIAYATNPLIANSYPITLSGYTSNASYTSKNIVCTNNIIKNLVPHWEGIDAHGCSNTIISNNVIINGLTGIAIVAPAETKNVTICDNYMEITFTDSIAVLKNNIGICVTTSTYAENITISGNTIKNFGNTTTGTSVGINNACAIKLLYVKNCNVSNNLIIDNNYCAINLTRYCLNVNINGNTIITNKATTYLFYGASSDIIAFIHGNHCNGEHVSSCLYGNSQPNVYIKFNNNDIKNPFTNYTANNQKILPDITYSNPNLLSLLIGNIGDIIFNKTNNNIFAYYCISASDGTTRSQWAEIKIDPNIT